MTEVLRTPDGAFAGLSDYPFQPDYTPSGWENPAYVLCSTGDPSTPRRRAFACPSSSPEPGPSTIDGAGHFLQEDQGEEVGRRIAARLRSLE
ncbi:MAG: hypothetical protein OEP52_07270 [Acidimicrobiia bacterium]|nr:hypothetical protein [Acidimicrobiia bacterium]